MLLSLHVKNLALIEEEEVAFTDGFNILTGETGAGKSVIIGSVNLALGAKADKSLIRTGEDYALIEMVFKADTEKQLEKLKEMDLPVEDDGTILIKRKIYEGRSVCSISGETVSSKQLREVAGLLIDIYGQRENHKLLKREAQLGVIDDFAGVEAEQLKDAVKQSWQKYRSYVKQWENDDLDVSARKREADLIAYEIKEIEDAELREGEDEQLEKDYRRLSGFQKIMEAVQFAGMLGEGNDSSAASLVERALRGLLSVEGLDEDLDNITAQLTDIDQLLSEFSRSLSDYMDDLSFDPGEFRMIEERLDLINHLKDKYGRTIAAVQKALAEKQNRLADLEDYEASREKLKKNMLAEKEAYLGLCAKLSALRKRSAKEFTAKLTEALLDLNFNQVDFEVIIEASEEKAGPEGYDSASFMISTNPGEARRPLEQIASGGELSRIMLALKTVFAGREDIHTLIFDEIDTGISGRTAWKVSEKIGSLASDHQVICITHLPQIAAMADSHYKIEKNLTGSRTATSITRLNDEESLCELGRLLGAEVITETTLENAKDMRRQALNSKRK